MSTYLLLLRLALAIFYSIIAILPTSAQELPAKPSAENEKTPIAAVLRDAKRDAFWEQAMRLQREGKFSEVIGSAQQMLAIEREWLGDASEGVRGVLDFIAETSEQSDDWHAAIQFRSDALQWYKKHLGDEHWRTTNARWALESARGIAKLTLEQRNELRTAEGQKGEATELFNQGEFVQAVELATKAADTQKRLLGAQRPSYATSLNNLASMYKDMGEYKRAEQLYTQTLQIRRTVLGEQHPEYALSLNNLALLYHEMSDYVRAEPLYVQALQIDKAAFGAQHADYATSLNNLAYLYYEMGDYTRAETLHTEAMQVRRTVLGEQHPDYAMSLNNLALLYHEMGEYVRAEPLLIQAMEINRAVLGEQHPDYSISLNNLALLYQDMGDYARAEPLYIQASQIDKVALGDQHPDYATSLNNLASLYYEMGDYARAEPLHTEALQIRKAVLGEQHPDYSMSLNNLALLYHDLGDYVRAEPLLIQAMEIDRAVLGEQHPDFSISLNNLALLYQNMQDYARAEPMYIQASQIDKAALGEQHPNYATSLNNLGSLYMDMGDYVRAEPLYQQAMRIDESVLGDQHPDFAMSLNNLALLYVRSQRFDLAVPLYEQALAITRKSLDETAYILSERQQLAMNQSLRYQFDNYLSACLAMPSVPAKAVENVMLWKGSVLYRLRGLRIAADDPSISEQFAKLQRAAAELSKLAQTIPAPDQVASWKERLAKLTAEKEALEAELMRNSAAFREAVQHVTFGQIQQSIPDDGVLLDYLEFAGEHGRSLLVSIVKRNAEPVMISLGSASEVGQAIDVWRASFGMSPPAKAAGLKLRELIWEPVLGHLGSAKTILVSTDGGLGRLPFAALPGKAPGSYLIEDHRLALIPVPQLLPALIHDQGRRKLQHELLLMGDVNYDAIPNQDPSPASDSIEPRKRPWERSELPPAVRGERNFNALTETRAEVEFIARLYNQLYQPGPEAVLDLRQAAASETAFRAYAPQCVFLHLATHGFFAAPENQSAMSTELVAQRGKERAGSSAQLRDAILGYSPGQLSGIVFAGANRKPAGVSDALSNQQPTDDGIMTADEIAFMRLEGVRLAVLSACETGLGEVAGGEGLLGIQRGFQMAGARSTIASLWKVNDAATRRLMQEFYTNYLDKELSMLDALRETQLWAMRNPGDVPRGVRRVKADDESIRLPPQYWAPFVLSGDWR